MRGDYEVLDADVLVVGGGPAGAQAAIRAAQLGASVILVEKAYLSRSGGALYAHSHEAPRVRSAQEREQWLREYVENSSYLIDQEWLQVFLEEAPKRIEDLVSWGVPYERDAQGALRYGQYGFGKVATVLHVDGMKLMEHLRKQVLSRPIRLVERVMLTDLLTSDGEHPTRGRVVGAVGFHTRTGRFYIFRSRATVIATGPFISKMHYTHLDNLTGDGQMTSFRAGAELAGLEFCHHSRFSHWARRFQGHGQSQLIALGARVLNADGERIMERYDPIRMEHAGLTPISRAIITENLEGRGPCYVDMRHFSQEELEILWRIAPATMKSFGEFGIDITKEPVEANPYVFLGMSAGLRIDLGAATNLPGLFAAGSVTYGGSGSSNTAAIGGATGASVAGYRAGESAWRAAQELGEASLDWGQVEHLREQAFAPLGRAGGVRPFDIFYAVNRISNPAPYSLFKSGPRIRETLERLRRVQAEELPQVSAPDLHELVKANEARNVAALADLGFRAALAREESRGDKLLREDFPFRDDRNWLKWILVRQGREGIEISLLPIPFERYPVQPRKREKVPTTIRVPSFPA